MGDVSVLSKQRSRRIYSCTQIIVTQNIYIQESGLVQSGSGCTTSSSKFKSFSAQIWVPIFSKYKVAKLLLDGSGFFLEEKNVRFYVRS
jgi:hypothetical protein